MDIKPLHDNVIIKPTPPENETKGGIIIPDTAKEKPQTGTIVAVGNGIDNEPMEVKNGDKVLFHKNTAREIDILDEKYLIMKQRDILAII